MSQRHYLGRESIPVTHHFTEEELKGFAQEMAAGLKEMEQIEEEKKSANDIFKSRLQKAESKAVNAGEKYRDGKETVYVYCNHIADYSSGEILWIDPDTGEVLQRRKMTDEERQVPLQLRPIPEPNKKHLPIVDEQPQAAHAN